MHCEAGLKIMLAQLVQSAYDQVHRFKEKRFIFVDELTKKVDEMLKDAGYQEEKINEYINKVRKGIGGSALRLSEQFTEYQDRLTENLGILHGNQNG